jgi:hypothetical protein
LHEAAHEMLAAVRFPEGPMDPERLERIRSRPAWLTEGLADYVGKTAAARAGFTDGDVFGLGGLEEADAVCAKRLQGPRGAEILPFIGAPGAPGAPLTTERTEVAPTFYACSTSFTKHLVNRMGLKEAIALMPLIPENGVIARIEALTAGTMDAIRAEWRKAIGVR